MGPVAAAPSDLAIVLATLDPYGWPHPALVSYAEILALDAARLRLGAPRRLALEPAPQGVGPGDPRLRGR